MHRLGPTNASKACSGQSGDFQAHCTARLSTPWWARSGNCSGIQSPAPDCCHPASGHAGAFSPAWSVSKPSAVRSFQSPLFFRVLAVAAQESLRAPPVRPIRSGLPPTWPVRKRHASTSLRFGHSGELQRHRHSRSESSSSVLCLLIEAPGSGTYIFRLGRAGRPTPCP